MYSDHKLKSWALLCRSNSECGLTFLTRFSNSGSVGLTEFLFRLFHIRFPADASACSTSGGCQTSDHHTVPRGRHACSALSLSLLRIRRGSWREVAICVMPVESRVCFERLFSWKVPPVIDITLSSVIDTPFGGSFRNSGFVLRDCEWCAFQFALTPLRSLKCAPTAGLVPGALPPPPWPAPLLQRTR